MFDLTYNDRTRLSQVAEAPSGNVLASYTYNAYGQRITKTTPTNTTHYVDGSGGQLMAELDDQGNTLRDYL